MVKQPHLEHFFPVKIKRVDLVCGGMITFDLVIGLLGIFLQIGIPIAIITVCYWKIRQLAFHAKNISSQHSETLFNTSETALNCGKMSKWPKVQSCSSVDIESNYNMAPIIHIDLHQCTLLLL